MTVAKRGDKFRVISGPRQGQVGTFVRVIPRTDQYGAHELIQLGFAGDEDSYFNARDVEPVKDLEAVKEGTQQ